MSSFLTEGLFVLSVKGMDYSLELTISELESLWKITEKRNITLHRKLDEFLGQWELRMRK